MAAPAAAKRKSEKGRPSRRSAGSTLSVMNRRKMAPVPCASAIQARETIPGPVRTLAVGRGNGLVPLAPREVPAFGRVERAMSVTIPALTPVNQARHRERDRLPPMTTPPGESTAVFGPL